VLPGIFVSKYTLIYFSSYFVELDACNFVIINTHFLHIIKRFYKLQPLPDIYRDCVYRTVRSGRRIFGTPINRLNLANPGNGGVNQRRTSSVLLCGAMPGKTGYWWVRYPQPDLS